MAAGTILHITSRAAWDEALASGTYRGDTLDTEGFIHCSTREQVLVPANAMFREQAGLVLLCIEVTKVEANIVYEDRSGEGQEFPHIYGPLNAGAVLAVVDFPPDADGSFALPANLPNGP